jgi:tetratricopeptide (TPR) repeat protein
VVKKLKHETGTFDGKGIAFSSPGGKGALSVLSQKYGIAAAPVLIAATALLIYSNTFHSPFLYDDIRYIVDNDSIRDLGNFLDISGSRSVSFFSFALNYHFGGLDVYGYHLVNVAIHIVNGTLVLLLASLTFKTPFMARSTIKPRLKYVFALTVALLFICHPVQTQAVTYITQRFASLATLFYLLSLALFVKWRLSRATLGAAPGSVIYAASFLSAVLAMKTKEISFTLPFIIFLYEFAFFDDKTPIRRRFRYLVPLLLTLTIIPWTYFAPELSLSGGEDVLSEEIRRQNILQLKNLSSYDYFVTQLSVIVTYLRLLVLPLGQTLLYDYPVYKSFFEPKVFLSFLFLLGVFALAIFLFKRSRKTRNVYALLASFGILWFFITLSVESSIFPLVDVIFEHRLYLPSVGALMALLAGVYYCLGAVRWRITRASPVQMSCILLLVTAVPLSLAAYKRNFVWQDALTFWSDNVNKYPESYVANFNLGMMYYRGGDQMKAINKLQEAVRNEPGLVRANYNLAVLYNEMGLLDEALKWYEKVIELDPAHYKAYNNIGIIYGRKNMFENAVLMFRMAIEINPHDKEAMANLSRAQKMLLGK